LLFKWHDSDYLGAGHGIIGILHVLLHSDEFQKIDPTISYDLIRKILSTQDPATGNFPTRMTGEPRYHLFQWCHGSTGVILTLILYLRKYGYDANILDSKFLAIEGLWQNGLLTKGVGLCHGISGNAYAFLEVAVYLDFLLESRNFNDVEKSLLQNQRKRLLDRVLIFSEFGWANLDSLSKVPDQPFSLMTGITGYCCLISDIIAFLKKESNILGFPLYTDL
jgi:lantibiotic modifying enzyme